MSALNAPNHGGCVALRETTVLSCCSPVRGHSDRADDERFVGDRHGWSDRRYDHEGSYGQHRGSGYDEEARDGRGRGGFGYGGFDQGGGYSGPPPFHASASFDTPPPPPPPRRPVLASTSDAFDTFEDRSLFPPPPPRPQRAQDPADDEDDPERRAFEAELRRVAADLDKV